MLSQYTMRWFHLMANMINMIPLIHVPTSLMALICIGCAKTFQMQWSLSTLTKLNTKPKRPSQLTFTPDIISVKIAGRPRSASALHQVLNLMCPSYLHQTRTLCGMPWVLWAPACLFQSLLWKIIEGDDTTAIEGQQTKYMSGWVGKIYETKSSPQSLCERQRTEVFGHYEGLLYMKGWILYKVTRTFSQGCAQASTWHECRSKQ